MLDDADGTAEESGALRKEGGVSVDEKRRGAGPAGRGNHEIGTDSGGFAGGET
jgi:hypothetical protein